MKNNENLLVNDTTFRPVFLRERVWSEIVEDYWNLTKSFVVLDYNNDGLMDIAIGNVIGSNVFNILLLLGLTATISPLEIEGITTIDLAVMLLSVVLVWLFSRTRYTVDRWEGAVLVGGYLVYLGWLITSL